MRGLSMVSHARWRSALPLVTPFALSTTSVQLVLMIVMTMQSAKTAQWDLVGFWYLVSVDKAFLDELTL